jgi:hypothetical protein
VSPPIGRVKQHRRAELTRLRLGQAFDDYVEPRRMCSRDDECTFVAARAAFMLQS